MLDDSTGLQGDRRPSPGDFMVCLTCATVLVLDAARKVRLPTDAELAEAEANPTLLRAVKAIEERNREQATGRTPPPRRSWS